MALTVIDDRQVGRVSYMEAVEIMGKAMLLRSQGFFHSPSRHHIDTGEGEIVITAGGDTRDHVAGLRVYTTFKTDDQFTAVYDSESGKLKGIVHGQLLGNMRTAAIGSLSIRHMARRSSSVLGIIGSGTQARHQTLAALSVGNFKSVCVYSPTRDHALEFRDFVQKSADLEIDIALSPDDVAAFSDVIIMATRSRKPVLSAGLIKPGTHIVSVGRKFVDDSELDPAIAERCSVIATDSIIQLREYPVPHVLGKDERVRELSEIVAGKSKGRYDDVDMTLFLSVGLSGTEPLLASYIIRKFEDGTL